MAKTLVGPRLRQLRRERGQTQAAMARALGVSAAYVNLLENNQRSLSVQMLMALSEAYSVDWRDMLKDASATSLADLRNTLQDPVFGDDRPDLQELRAAIDHAPKLVAQFLRLHRSYRGIMQSVMRQGGAGLLPELAVTSPETVIHDFFRDHRNHFEDLEEAAEALGAEEHAQVDDTYGALKARLAAKWNITVRSVPVDEMPGVFRLYDEAEGQILMSTALDHQNRTFQLAHVLALVEYPDVLDRIIATSGIAPGRGQARCRVELANYFAAALLMPYDRVLAAAERSGYDINEIANDFDVSFEQVCHRLTTLQRDGALGVPFFFLRVDKAGNVTKRFNSTSFHLAEHGGACPLWNIHTAFRVPGVILPQFVELPDGARFFTISRTTNRPVFNRDSQDRGLAVTLGCEMQHVDRIRYASAYNLADPGLFTPIGINCHLCPRQACAQRAHQPLHMDLPIDANRRGSTRYES